LRRTCFFFDFFAFFFAFTQPETPIFVVCLTTASFWPVIAIVGALFEILYGHATHKQISHLPQLTPQFAYISLAPFIGPTQAAEFVKAKLAEHTPANEPPAQLRRDSPSHA
jgi:hypothetical protein